MIPAVIDVLLHLHGDCHSLLIHGVREGSVRNGDSPRLAFAGRRRRRRKRSSSHARASSTAIARRALIASMRRNWSPLLNERSDIPPRRPAHAANACVAPFPFFPRSRLVVVAATSAVLAVVTLRWCGCRSFADAARPCAYAAAAGTSDFSQANPLSAAVFARDGGQAGSLSGIGGIRTGERGIGGEGEPESVPGGRVSNGFFSLLGASPAIGRTFTRDEELANARLAALSHGLWQRRYGGKPDVLGRTILIDREPFTVIGDGPRVPAGLRGVRVLTRRHPSAGA